MFPLSDLAVLALTASAPFLAGALTGVYRRRWLLLTLTGAAAVFFLVYIRPALNFESSNARQLAVALFGAIFLAAWLLGELWGLALRLLRRRKALTTVTALTIAILPAIAASGWTLTRQYVSASCLDGLTVAMADQSFHIDPGDNARLSWNTGGSGETWAFYSTAQNKKDSLAHLCRQSANGKVALAPDELLLGKSGNRTTSCQGNAPCHINDRSEFRLLRTSPTDPTRPSAWFGADTRDDVRWSGTATDGWICFLPNGSLTWLSCQRWTTPFPGLRAHATADFAPDNDPEGAAQTLDQTINTWLTRLTQN